MTIRRLADEIEYSQPVIYAHFDNRNAIVAAVALEGFRELGAALRQALDGASGERDGLEKIALAYLDFAERGPALYEAMFVLPTELRFADAESRPELRAAFEALAAAVSPFCDDAALGTETVWAALHGLAELERAGRIRPGVRSERVMLLVHALGVARHAG